MSNMGYHWDDNLKAYYYCKKRSSKLIYNYDEPAEFGTVHVKKQQVEDQVHHVDTSMADPHHDEDYAWLRDVEKNEDPQGWGQWQHNS